MMRTKRAIALVSGSILFLTSSIGVFAQSPLDSLSTTFESVFGSRIFANFFDRLGTGEASAMFWAKFLIWALLFAVIDYGLSFVFKEKRKTATIVAGIISLISVVAIPRAILLTIFQAYSTVVSFILLLLPIIVVIALHVLLKRVLQDHPRMSHLAGALLTLMLFGISTFMFSAFRSVRVPGASGESFFAMVGNSPFALWIQAALLVWAIYDIILFIVGGTTGAGKTGSWLKGKASGAFGGDTPATSEPMADLRQRIDAQTERMQAPLDAGVRESREEQRVLQQMRGLDQENVAELEKIKKNLGVIENALNSIGGSQTLQQKQDFLHQVQEEIQKIVPEEQHVREHLINLERDLGLLAKLERSQFEQVGEEHADVEKIDAAFHAYPTLDSSQKKEIRKNIQQKLSQQAQELRRQYVETQNEKQFFTQIEDALRSFAAHMSMIVTSINEGDINASVNHAREAKIDVDKIESLTSQADERNGLIARQVKQFNSDSNIKALIDEFTA